jgi:hypothetical protein
LLPRREQIENRIQARADFRSENADTWLFENLNLGCTRRKCRAINSRVPGAAQRETPHFASLMARDKDPRVRGVIIRLPSQAITGVTRKQPKEKRPADAGRS